jgi:outer membrane protein TolC
MRRLEGSWNGREFVVKERIARPSILAAALLLCWVEVSPCAAQAPASANATYPTPGEQRAAVSPATTSPAVTSVSSDGGLALPSSLPSTVSPELERFAKKRGQGSLSALPAIPSPRVRAAGLRGPATAATAQKTLASTVSLKPAPFAPTDLRFPINLAAALRLSDARPLIVAAAQARVWIAEAELTKAKVIWIPALNLAFDYLRHDGGGPDFNKGIMTAVSTNFFYGGLGLWGVISTTDAIYEPLATRQVLNSRQWDIQTAKNDALLQTTDAYFMVHQYRGMYASALYTVERGHDLVERIAALGRDLVPAYEVDRARNVLADLEQKAVSARQEWRVQSAKLTKVLRLDPRAVVEPLEHDHLQITLIDPTRVFDDLMPIAVSNRPEVASRRALVQAAEVRVRRERARPFIPQVILTGYQSPGGMLIQAGIFGFGANSSLNQWVGRDDVSIQLTWQLQNFGFGNLARIKEQRGMESQAIIELRKTQDTVAEEVNQAHARLQSATARVSQADRSLRTGIITFNGALEGLKQTSRFGDVLELVTRPQEAVYSLQMLRVAFDEYFATVAEYNRAQFGLFHALGYPAHQVARFRPPGQAHPVNTARPDYLPPVGNGPPPVTQ